jgi:hypothetical protein
MIYKAYLIQKGEGCDYTIGCAQTIIDIDADSMEEARQTLIQIILDEYSGEDALESAELYEISQVINMDVEHIYERADKIATEIEKQEQEQAERDEYERLKQKFE